MVLILVVIIGGGDGYGRNNLDLPRVWPQERGQLVPVPALREAEALNGTPDWLARDTSVHLRVAGAGLVDVDRSLSMVGQGQDVGQRVDGDAARRSSIQRNNVESFAPPEGGIDGAIGERPRLERQADDDWLLTIYCRLNDDTGSYTGFTASGIQVAEVDPETGFRMVACSGHWDFGATFLVAGHWPMVCRDRGSAVINRNHLDAYFYDCGDQEDPAPGTGWAWLQQVGDRAIVEVIHE